ncbi:Hypothetical protein SRAE_1000212800 [Strongyloides ratti]|uniref:Uncharacterized protein n=1 Tax=Strongyloides ratti TaxID=34506 RepID=A0A090L2F1_STRRB|nr:Hypothetical protein SRAE_1000212800 [Strongyloides ratti]CEF63872.1 Hypothetical protein SRAE_1000212800 [Strongyloides ratti]
MGRVYEYRPDSDDVFESKLLHAMKEDGRVDFNVRNLPDVCDKCSIPINYWDYMTKSSPNGKHWSYHIDRMIKKGYLRARKYKGGNPIEFSVINSDSKPKKNEKQPLEFNRKLNTLFMEQLFHILLHKNIDIINVDSIPSYCKHNNVSLNYWATIKGNKGILKQYLKCMEDKNMLQIIELDKYKFPLKIKINRSRESVIRHVEDVDRNSTKENYKQNQNVSTINNSISSYENILYSNNMYEQKDDDVFINTEMMDNNNTFLSPKTSSNNIDHVLQNKNVFASISSLGLLEDYNFENEIDPFEERSFVNQYMQSISSGYNSLYNISSSTDLITPLDFKCSLFSCMEKDIFYTIEALQDSFRCYYGLELTTTMVNEIFHTKCPSLDIAIYSNINCIILKKSEDGTVSICRY